MRAINIISTNQSVVLVFFLNFVLLGARFVIFSGFVALSESNAEFYSLLVSTNAYIPILLFGASISQSALYPKLISGQKPQQAFFQSFGLFVALISSVSFLYDWQAGLQSILKFALLQYSVNYIYQSMRSDDRRLGILLTLLEVLVVAGLFLALTPNDAFKYLFHYYAWLLIFIAIYRLFKFNIKFKSLITTYYLTSAKTMFRQSPVIAKEYADVILVGFFAPTEVVVGYATVILCTAPVKIVTSNVTIALNLVLAKYNKFYSDILGSNQVVVGIILSILAIGICVTLHYFVFPESNNFVAAGIRALGISVGFLITMKILDSSQMDADFRSTDVVLTLMLAFGVSVLITQYLPLLETFAAIPLLVLSIFGVVTAISKKLRELKV